MVRYLALSLVSLALGVFWNPSTRTLDPSADPSERRAADGWVQITPQEAAVLKGVPQVHWIDVAGKPGVLPAGARAEAEGAIRATMALERLVEAEARVQALTGAIVRATAASKDVKALEDVLATATKAADDLAKALP